ncbi:MAG: HD domain-containing protein [Bacteroidales bacterium]|nr:HD domain-containing protein [Bacteroidales bacterium]
MNNIELKISQAEQKYLSILSNYCLNIFSKKQIPSHNETHHYRVWQYCKEIIHTISSEYPISQNLVESCLIAALFHDTGLSVNLNEKHGKESRIICENFFNENKEIVPNNFEQTLNAIELHDDKNYKNSQILPNSVFSILCNADDLDAFGKIGVIRYTDIYLMRGINLNDLPKLVLKNLDMRFANFEKTYKQFDSLVAKHKKRFFITKKFFDDMILELN